MQKRWSAFLLAVMCAAGLVLPASAAPSAEAAEERTAGLQISLNGSVLDAVALTDQNTFTKLSVRQGDCLTLESPQPLGGIYLEFDRPPMGCTVTVPGEEILLETEFLHQWIPFSKEADSVMITLTENVLCELSAWSEGEPPPERVQRWEPPCEDADLLLLPTHADDDQLWFGAAMATYADRGYDLQVAYLTHHWGERYRPHELLNGLWQSGVHTYPVIPEFADYYSESLEHAKTLYDLERMQGYMVGLLRRFRPEVVIGHDPEGEYGHGVHCLNTWLLMNALEQSADASVFPESAAVYGTFDVPKTYLHLYPEQPMLLDIDTPLLTLGGRTAFEVAEDGYACHLSQQQYWFKVFRGGIYSCRAFGLYRTTVGPDSGQNDMFEHITAFSDDAPSAPERSEEESSLAESLSAEETASQPQPDTAAGAIPTAMWYLLGLLAVLVMGFGVWLFGHSRKK